MYNFVIDKEGQEKYPIRPEHISLEEHFSNAFNNAERESSAHWIVHLCKKKGGWLPFSIQEINTVYQEMFPKEEFQFNGLDTEFVILGYDKLYRVTHKFIARCFLSYPILFV